ncbi:Acyl-CoA dehydrogenase [Sphingomonas laterariae]|uniref:Acyl-CoA dehydrogenase n=1 Tax=Edaphosphingomonas laterariae TaxID=861865 RepID=A0A239HFZ1_9SPHN|nr:acyl-CoA dehydrogenase family protein [Sphingomonas laterariae]SNS80277.1 Acyl-CoA dehydrogenase [Sphingomonas laterariae]
MRLDFTPEQEAFRAEVRTWLDAQLSGEFAHIREIQGISEGAEQRFPWERHLGRAGWNQLSWPKAFGGREANLFEQVIFHEEYARSGAPGRLSHVGLELVAPTIMAFGNDEQRQRFLKPTAEVEIIWAQLFSEPNAGSDLANVQTRARLEDRPGGQVWVLEGQKIWSSFAQYSQWGMALVRTEPGSVGSKGLSMLLIPLDAKGVDIRPIRQMSGGSSFNEVFLDGAETAAANVLGAAGEGWKVAMGTLTFERGVSTLGQQMGFRNELDHILRVAKENGAARNPGIAKRLARAQAELRTMRYTALRMLGGSGLSLAGLTYKLYYTSWHQRLGELAMDVLGPAGEIAVPGSDAYRLQKMYLESRSDSIWAGTSQIQRNIIAERGLGLPREGKAAR